MKTLIWKTLVILFAVGIIPISIDAHTTTDSPDPNTEHGYVTWRNDWGPSDNWGADVYAGAAVHDMIWIGRHAYAVHKVSVWNFLDIALDYAVKFEFRVVRLGQGGGFLAAIYNPPIVFEQGIVPANDEFHWGDYHNDYELTGEWEEGDRFRVEARTVVAVWEDIDDQDEWAIYDYVDLTIDEE